MSLTDDRNIRSLEPLLPPQELKASLPLPAELAVVIQGHRQAISRILSGEDTRFLAIVGPCSVHHPGQALEYAERLAKVSTRISDVIFPVMRAYFEKPRTTVGWKGLITDPNLDGTGEIPTGLARAREFLLQVAKLKLPAATEFLDPIVPQYVADLVSWAAIGARTTESQTHREMASGLSMPVGFKNGTDGNWQTALDAMVSARSEHQFLGISSQGLTSIVKTRGNPAVHLVLRGGRGGQNCDEATIGLVLEQMQKMKIPPALLVDCSHANSGKKPRLQPNVWRQALACHINTHPHLIGAMLESFLEEGNQEPGPVSQLKWGVSITDACLGWAETETLLEESAATLRSR